MFCLYIHIYIYYKATVILTNGATLKHLVDSRHQIVPVTTVHTVLLEDRTEKTVNRICPVDTETIVSRRFKPEVNKQRNFMKPYHRRGCNHNEWKGNRVCSTNQLEAVILRNNNYVKTVVQQKSRVSNKRRCRIHYSDGQQNSLSFTLNFRMV